MSRVTPVNQVLSAQLVNWVHVDSLVPGDDLVLLDLLVSQALKVL